MAVRNNKASATRKATPDAREALVDKALKKRWTEAIGRYRVARDEASAGWDARYEALDEIISSEPPYYLAGGYATIGAFLRAEVPNESARGVNMAIRVARHFDPEDESKYGMTNLDVLLRYLEADAGGPLGKAKIDPSRQKIRVKVGKTTKLVPFAQATREQVRAAARVAQGRGGGASAALPPMVKTLKKALSEAGLSAVAVSMRAGKVTLSGIAPESLGALAKALKGVKA